MKSVLAVALGGVGSVLRYLVGALLLRSGMSALPWGTFAVNVSGALALGFLARYFGPPHGSSTLFLGLTLASAAATPPSPRSPWTCIRSPNGAPRVVRRSTRF